ncbi:MAG TPA: type II toxin-antitoxin system VapC family toxin [Pseudonocardiaceae bacterium]|nr:type II toxin-antitoxin system VapC family toxin [Pseudonocardiaceae bacterium]
MVTVGVHEAKTTLSGDRALVLIGDSAHELLLSAASSWEMAIKYGLGKLLLPLPPAQYVPDRMRRSGVVTLPVSHTHVLRVADLPVHHRDPFGRMLVAQAQCDSLTLLTADPLLRRYDVPIEWAG